MVTVGILANPSAGKDIRRLISAASSSSDMAKVGIVRRALVGALAGGADRVLIANDHKSLGRQALKGLDYHLADRVEIIGDDAVAASFHSRRMAALLRDREVGAMVTLGGDGTHRDIVKGWRNAPLVPLSTGTNNVFPRMVEATVAGHAAAIAAGALVPMGDLAHQAKVLDVAGDVIEDLALVDIAFIDARFTASRAVWEVSSVRELIVTTAEPATIGLSSIAARVQPVGRRDDGGAHVVIGPGQVVRAPIAPGRYEDVSVASAEPLAVGQTVTLSGSGVIAFDGERDVVLGDGEHVDVTLRDDGPFVIDPTLALRFA